MILSWEQWLSLQHLRKDAGRTPNIHFHVVLLPCEHDFRGAIIPGRDIACHLGVLDTGKAEVANFQIAVFVDKDVARFQITMDDTRRVDIFQSPLQMVSAHLREKPLIDDDILESGIESIE